MKGISGGGTKKYGRNKDKCAKYALAHTREKNKIRRYTKMLKKLQGNSQTAVDIKNKIRALERLI